VPASLVADLHDCRVSTPLSPLGLEGSRSPTELQGLPFVARELRFRTIPPWRSTHLAGQRIPRTLVHCVGDASLSLSGDVVAQKVPVAADGTREGPDMDDLAVDVCDLCHCTGGAGANNDPGTLPDPGGVFRLVDEPPGKACVVLGVEVKLKVDGVPGH
jgi:hypothetical protein